MGCNLSSKQRQSPQKIGAAAGHQSQQWFRKSQLVILMYDVTHGHKEGHNDGAYSDNKLHDPKLDKSFSLDDLSGSSDRLLPLFSQCFCCLCCFRSFSFLSLYLSLKTSGASTSHLQTVLHIFGARGGTP